MRDIYADEEKILIQAKDQIFVLDAKNNSQVLAIVDMIFDDYLDCQVITLSNDGYYAASICGSGK